MIELPVFGDLRGQLVAIEGSEHAPFEIKRVYYLCGTDLNARRGFHAHKDLTQLAICVNGSCTMHLDDGRQTASVVLDRPDKGLLIGSMVWREISDFSQGCVLLVLASNHFREEDYIRDRQAFLEAVKDPTA